MAELISPAYTRALGEVIREIEPDPALYRGIQYMPAVERPTDDVYVDVWEATGGATLEHTLDTDPLNIQKKAFRTLQFSAGKYRESIRFGESDILRLRRLGTADLSQRGIQQHLEENARRLNTRIETRMEMLRWQAIFNGSYIYDGRVIDFGVPALNSVAPTTVWATRDASGRLVSNDASNPVLDLRFWTMGGYDIFRKYQIRKMVMNPNTSRMFIESKAVQQLIAPAITGGFVRTYDINGVLSYVIPGIPEVDVYAGTYFNETIDPVTGKISVSTSQYFIPDGKIYFETNLPDNNRIGEIAMTLNLSNGDIGAPASGKFVITDQRGLADVANPSMKLVSGFNGGPALTRSFDLLTATVFS
jgi:hypothetical protein